MKVNRTTCITTLIAVGALAYAGTGCPDPYTYHLTQGSCTPDGIFWINASHHSIVQGGCSSTSHTSASHCTVNMTMLDCIDYDLADPVWTGQEGEKWKSCPSTHVTDFGDYGISWGACNYCTGT
jgi:hypothetical protein